MDIIQPNPFNGQPIKFDVTKFEMIKESFNKGELKIAKVDRFRNQWPKHRHSLYMIDYRVNNQVIMYNAFEIPTALEEKLLKEEKLLPYICFQMTFRL